MIALPAYSSDQLAALDERQLIGLMRGDEDRVPRSVIDECARRGEEMVAALEGIAGEDRAWQRRAALDEWWLRLHAVMILGLVASERAGLALARFMRRMAEAGDENLQDWFAGNWPALFRNKPQRAVEAARALAAERGLGWYLRAQAVEVGLAAALAQGAEALEGALDAVAAIAADEGEDETMRLAMGNALLDFPRPRHRPLLERLAARQAGPFRQFAPDDIAGAYAAGRDKPDWERLGDPWDFYSPARIAQRRERWAKEAAAAARRKEGRLKVGRNDPCPCGSGKKYKHCCLAAASAAAAAPGELAWRRLRRLLDGHQRDMLRFATNVYGRVAIEEAWRYFVSDGEARFEPESRHLQIFMPWLYHCWSPDPQESRVRDKALHGVAPTAAYLRRKKRLDPLLREYLESCLAAPFSAFEILRADPGRGFLMKDLFTGAEHDVIERSASAAMQEGDLVFGQVARAGGVTLLEASQAFAIPPIWKIQLLELRQRCFEGAAAVAPERLRMAQDELLELYLDIEARLFSRKPPVLQNTDGEPLSLRRVVFEVPSAQEAFDALKRLALDESDEDLLREAERDAGGALARVRFSWLKRGNAQNPAWDNTVLGSVEIDGARLTIGVNSEKREQAARALVAEALGGRARYRATEIESVEKLLADAPRGRKSASGGEAAGRPEVQAKLREIMLQHYEQWVNDRIPALGGRTPLEAVRDPAGREAVEALVRQIERDGPRMQPPLDPAIARRLRERLGLG